MKPITIAYTPAISGLVLIAKEQNFFKKNGVYANFRASPTGRRSLEYLQKNWVDLANLVDTNIANLSLQKKQNIRVIACSQINNGESILIHPYKNIKTPADLAGRTIALMPKTSSHGFLYKFCNRYQIDITTITQEHITHEAAAKKLINGVIDAAIMWEPHSTETQIRAAQNGLNVQKFTNDGFYAFHSCLAANDKALRTKRTEIKAALHALQEAEDFIQNQPQAARAILAHYMDVPPAIFEKLFQSVTYTLTPVHNDFIDQVHQQVQWIDPAHNHSYGNIFDTSLFSN